MKYVAPDDCLPNGKESGSDQGLLSLLCIIADSIESCPKNGKGSYCDHIITLLWPVVDIIKRCQASEVESYFDQ
jgi:hypothetical protein